MTIEVTKAITYKIVMPDTDYIEIEPSDYDISVYERSSFDNSIFNSYNIRYEALDELIEVLSAIKAEREASGL
jgi:hypothetical protein